MTDQPVIYSGPIVKIEQARIENATFYFTGKPCKRGHINQRFTVNRTCKSCSPVNQKSVRDADIERARARDRDYHARNREKQNEKCRNWRRENKEKQAALSRDWISRNRDKYKAMKDKNRRDNPERYKSYTMNRRARIKSSEGKVLKCDILKVLANQKNKCAEPICKADLREGYHIDHIMPFALGGEHSPRNIQALCPTCNLKKGSKHPVDWAKENGRLL